MARQSGPRGRLVLGASSTPGETLLPRLAAVFYARYPEVTLEVRVADTEEILAALTAHEVEAAVVGREVEDPRLVGRVIGEDELLLVVAAVDPLAGRPDDSVPAKDLADRMFVLREEGSVTRLVVEEGLRTAGIEARVALELGSNAAVVGAVAAGAGVGVVPRRTLVSQPAVRPLSVRGLRFRRPFVLVVERGRALSPAAEAFVALCAGQELW